MPSTYGKRHGLAGYDTFRTGLRFATVQQMLRVASDEPSEWRQKSRGCVLGLWHSLKMSLYQLACDRFTKGPTVELATEYDAELECKRTFYRISGDVQAVHLRGIRRPDWFVIIHRSSKGRNCWQISHFDADGAVGDTERATLAEALNSYELVHMFRVEKVS